MVFSMGNKTLPDIIDEITNGLITTTGGYWSDADTNWNTTTRTGDSARRALKYNNLTTGEILYIALESINLTKHQLHQEQKYIQMV